MKAHNNFLLSNDVMTLRTKNCISRNTDKNIP